MDRLNWHGMSFDCSFIFIFFVSFLDQRKIIILLLPRFSNGGCRGPALTLLQGLRARVNRVGEHDRRTKRANNGGVLVSVV